MNRDRTYRDLNTPLTKRIEENVLGQDISLGHNAFEKTLEPTIGTPTAAEIAINDISWPALHMLWQRPLF
jgi:hypothetical protein